MPEEGDLLNHGRVVREKKRDANEEMIGILADKVKWKS